MMKCANKTTFEFTNVYMWAIIALTLLGAVAWQLSTFPLVDDWQYSCTVISPEKADFMRCAGEPIDSWADVCQSVCNHFYAMNGRLVHILYIPMQLLPREFHSLIAGLFIGLMFLGLLVISGNREKYNGRAFVISVAVMLLWCAFPWYNHFQSAIYQLNYSMTSAMWLGYLLWMRRLKTMPLKEFVLFFTYTFLTGWMHEGFTCTFIAATFFYGLFYKDIRRRCAILMVPLLISLALQMSSGTSGRASDVLAFREFSGYFIDMTSLVSQLWPLWLAIGLMVAAVITMSSRSRLNFVKSLLPLYAGIGVSIAQSALLNLLERSLFPAILLSCIIILLSLRKICAGRKSQPSKAWHIAEIIALLLYSLWIVQLIRYQQLTTAQWNEIFTEVGKRDSPTDDVVFADITQPWEHPWYLMDMTGQRVCIDENENQFFYDYFMRQSCHYIMVLPESFKGKNFEEWPEIPGENDFRGQWPVIASPAKHKYATVRFGKHLPQVKPTDRLLSAVKARSLRTDTTEQKMWFDISEVRIPSGDSVEIYYIHLPVFDIRTNERREFNSIDTVEICN